MCNAIKKLGWSGFKPALSAFFVRLHPLGKFLTKPDNRILDLGCKPIILVSKLPPIQIFGISTIHLGGSFDHGCPVLSNFIGALHKNRPNACPHRHYQSDLPLARTCVPASKVQDKLPPRGNRDDSTLHKSGFGRYGAHS